MVRRCDKGPYTPEGIRIPSSIELLVDTPYYADPNQPDSLSEGSFAPQKVKVLQTQASWSIGSATWQIETLQGPRWIRPKPWEIDIAPPPSITLLEETPLYAKQSEKGEPAAWLSPQEVQVTAAEKQWFYTNQPDSKAWIQVHTTWMGDLWAHIPVNRIGTVEKVKKKAHYYSLNAGIELGAAMGIVEQKAAPFEQQDWLQGDYDVIGEFTTIYDRAFQIQTDKGTTWSRDRGVPVESVDEILEVKSETPLIASIWESPFKELGLLQEEKVTVFEKVTEPLWTGRGPRPIWYGSTWFHVRTSKGTGWINKQYGVPESAVPVRWKVELLEPRELNRYPGIPYETSTLLIRNQTVMATSAADDVVNGVKWLKVTAEGRTGWIPFWSGGQDRIWDEEAGTAMQISVSISSGTNIVFSAENEDLKLYTEQKVGFKENGKEYLDAVQMAEQLRFKAEKASYAEAITFSQGDYSFTLEDGFGTALIYWQGILQRSVGLLEHPRHTGDSWYLGVQDLRTLFGLTQNVSYNNYGLYVKNYKVELSTLPTVVKNGRLEFQAFLSDWTSREELAAGLLPLKLSLEENGDKGGIGFVSNTEPVLSGTALDKLPWVTLFRVSASRQLAPGPHLIDAVLRVGERIVWKQTIRVTAE
jgi:hypothetical protein